MEEHYGGSHTQKTEVHHESVPQARGPIVKVLLGRAAGLSIFSEKILFILLTTLGFILPLFFWPDPVVAPEFSKILLLEVAVLFGMFIWGIMRLRDGRIEIPRSLLLGATLVLLLEFTAAAFASPVPRVSFFGSGYDVGTVNIFAVLCLLLFLASAVYKTRDRALYLIAAFLLASGITEIYHLARHLVNGPSFLDFGVFVGATATPVGKWNDFGVFSGASVVLSLIGLYFFSGNRTIKYLSVAVFLVGLFFLLITDFTVLWFVLFVFAGLIVALAIYEGELTHRHMRKSAAESGAEFREAKPLPRRLVGHLPWLAFVLLLVSFIYGSGLSTYPLTKDGKSIAGIVGTALRAPVYSEVVLTPSLTFDIVSSALDESPVFGVGPNRFSSAYFLNKASDINTTPFWDVAFESGLGRVPTMFATTGWGGIILWIIFLATLLWKGRAVYALLAKDRVAAFIGFSLFVLSLYFWCVAFFYIPNIAIFAYAFIMTGALIAFLASEGMISVLRVEFGVSKRATLILTPLIVIVIVGMVAGGVLVFRQTASLVYFNNARVALAGGDVVKAETEVFKAISMTERDTYWRFLASVDLAKLQILASDQILSQDDKIAAANRYIAEARTAAEHAIAFDPTNHENYLASGGVYDVLGSFGIGNTFDSARAEYEKALALNPHSPRVLFLLGRVALLSNDRARGKEYLGKALVERPNFVEALSVLAQLEIADKHPERAIEILHNATVAEPTNFVLHFTLGYMRYSVRDYQEAIRSLENAVILNPVYANAKYFLGLSYAHVNRPADAIVQFKDVAALNPDNEDIPRIIRNIELGRDPLTPNIVAPEPTNEVLDEKNVPKANEAEAGETENPEG